jgi:acyl-CoA synthetase (AMP-forming)/AMP-acid ligase II
MSRLRAKLPSSPIGSDYLDEASTLTEAIVRLGREHPEHTCLIFLDHAGREEKLTLGDLLARASEVQAAVEERGLVPGDPAVLILPTGAELVAAYFGILFAGGIPALASTPTQRAAEPAAYGRLIGGILANGPARLAYCDESAAAVLSGGPSPVLERSRLLRPTEVADRTSQRAPIIPDPDRVATVQFSSGSTGAPKGIRLSHRAMLNNIRAVRDGLALTSRDVSVNWIPLYHDMGLIDAFLLPLLCGCPTVLIPTTDFIREPRLWLEALDRYGGTISWAPNFAYALCVQRIREEQLAGLDLSRWRLAINAAEPVLARTLHEFAQRFVAYGFRPEAMTPAWGLAENVTIATALPPGRRPRIETIDRRALASEGVARPTDGAGIESVAIGRCLPRCSVEIRDGDRVLGERQVGEIWLRSDSLFEGYHRDPELTARMLSDGWLNTGDRGYLSDGDLFFMSRAKDLIVIAGEKYAPHDIETAINQVEGVREGCAVAFGVLDPDRGTEGVAAIVETKLATPEELEALARAIRSRVTRATGLALRHLKLVPPGGIQKTTSGKLARAATRDRHAADFAASA